MTGDAACAKLLIEFGANVDVTDSKGWTPLMHAVFQGENLACVQVLLAAGADVTRTLNSGVGVDDLAANNSTPEIGKAIQTAIEKRRRAAIKVRTQRQSR